MLWKWFALKNVSNWHCPFRTYLTLSANLKEKFSFFGGRKYFCFFFFWKRNCEWKEGKKQFFTVVLGVNAKIHTHKNKNSDERWKKNEMFCLREDKMKRSKDISGLLLHLNCPLIYALLYVNIFWQCDKRCLTICPFQ